MILQNKDIVKIKTVAKILISLVNFIVQRNFVKFVRICPEKYFFVAWSGSNSIVEDWY